MLRISVTVSARSMSAAGRVAAGGDDVDLGGAVADRLHDLVGVDPAPVHRIGDLVEDDQAVLVALDQRFGLPPRLPGDGLVLREIVGVPGEALADREPVDAQLAADLLLAGVPVARLEELHDRDPPVPGDGAQRRHRTQRSTCPCRRRC